MDTSMPASYYDRRCTPYHTDEAARMKKIEAFIPTVVPHVHNCTPEMERLITAVTDFESIIFLHTSESRLYDSYWANFEKGYRNAYNEMRFRMIDLFQNLQQGSKKSKSLLTSVFRLNKSQKSEYPAVATADLALLQSIMPNLQNPADFLDALKRVVIAQQICYLMQINHENLWSDVDGFENVTRVPFFIRVFQGSADEIADSSMLSTSSFSEDEGEDPDRSSSTMKSLTLGLTPPTSGARKTRSLRSAGSNASTLSVTSADPTGIKSLIDVKVVYELNCKLRRDVNGMFNCPKKARDKHVDLITRMVDDVIEMVHSYFTEYNQCRIY